MALPWEEQVALEIWAARVSPSKASMPSCWPTGKKTAAGHTERKAATQYGRETERKQVNEAGKNRKGSSSLTKISHVLLLALLSPELLGGVRQTTSGMSLYLLPVFRISSQAPSTHKTLSRPWGAGWLARWAHAKNSFLCRESPASPHCSRDVHQSSWVLLTSNAKLVSLAFRKTGHLSHCSRERTIWQLSFLHGEPQGTQALQHMFSAHLSHTVWMPNVSKLAVRYGGPTVWFAWATLSEEGLSWTTYT